MPLETLVIDPNYSIQRTILTPQLRSQVGDGRVRVRRQSARPVYQFTLIDRQQNAATADALWQFARRHQGDTPFWWSGDQWGALSSPVLVGEGDGVKTTFWLPNRFLLDVPLVYLDDVLASTQPDADVTRGQLLFAAPVMAEVVITARYTCRYQVLFWFGEDTLLTQELFYKQLFTTGVILRESGIPNDETESIILEPAYVASWEYDPFAALVEYYQTIFDY